MKYQHIRYEADGPLPKIVKTLPPPQAGSQHDKHRD
jgi:hypothetical protein